MLFNWENGLGVARHGVHRLRRFRRIHLGLRELELVEAAAQCGLLLQTPYQLSIP